MDVIERQSVETKNTLYFLKYVLARRGQPPGRTGQGGPSRNSMLGTSIFSKFTSVGSIGGGSLKQMVHKAKVPYGEHNSLNPADYIKRQNSLLAPENEYAIN